MIYPTYLFHPSPAPHFKTETDNDLLIGVTLRHLRFVHLADILRVLFMEYTSQAIVDDLCLSARMFLRPTSNITQNIGAHGKICECEFKIIPRF
jgi:hypothetical protein